MLHTVLKQSVAQCLPVRLSLSSTHSLTLLAATYAEQAASSPDAEQAASSPEQHKEQGKGDHRLLTALILWTLDQDLKLEAEDSWALGILVTALQGEVEAPSHVPWLLVLQPEHLRVGDGSWDIVFDSLLLPLTVGDIEVEKGDTGP